MARVATLPPLTEVPRTMMLGGRPRIRCPTRSAHVVRLSAEPSERFPLPMTKRLTE